MITLAMRAVPPMLWLTLFMSTLAFLFAVEGAVVRIYDWWKPPVEMTWQPDGPAAVRFSGVKHRGECDLLEIRAWGETAVGHVRLRIERDGSLRNSRLPAGPFGPSVPWAMTPIPIGDPVITAEFECNTRSIVVDVPRNKG